MKAEGWEDSLPLVKELDQAVICVVGLGVVGLPLAQAFAGCARVIGLDVDEDKLEMLKQENHNPNLELTPDPTRIGEANFILIAVPTALSEANAPDMSYIERACHTIGHNMRRGSTVIVESTVYPGTTEEIVKPILESYGWRHSKDFRLACSPERVNPGDDQHSLSQVTKVVAGMDEATTDLVARLYQRIVPQVHKAKDIRTAEASKLVENIQRDVNIALVNELALLLETLGLDTRDVLQAAATKWNFAPYCPGLVGGHCIPVAPHYLLHKARETGFNPRLIPLAREINDSMPHHIAQMTIKALTTVRGGAADARILVLGLTYKENMPDTRYSPIAITIAELQRQGAKIWGYDPLAPHIQEAFNIWSVRSLESLAGLDCIILAVAHHEFRGITLDELKRVSTDRPILIDIRGLYDGREARAKGFYYRSL